VFQEECGAIIEAGCQDMLTKPINVPLLFKTLAEYLPIQYRLADTADTRATEAADAQPDQALPTALSAALLAAAERLDGDAIEALLPDLTTLAPTLAASLSQALKAFDFEQLSRLLEAAQYLTHKGEAKAE
jgi:CheY-like chemotaxis protein